MGEPFHDPKIIIIALQICLFGHIIAPEINELIEWIIDKDKAEQE